MKFGSVCSGIEAASVAWHPLGWKASWLAEIEPFPSAVLAHHYPDVTNLGDMTKIAEMVTVGSIEAPDVLVGGTPCQAFSVAGLRNGLSDDRGFLTIKFVGLADAIDNKRKSNGLVPAVVVWENVPGVLSSKDNAFGCFLAALAGEDEELKPAGKKWSNAGCVFGPSRTIAWRVLDAQYFGVAQRRRRVFVVASARDDFDPTAVLFESDGVRRDSAPSREAGKEAAGAAGAGAEKRSEWPAEIACTLNAAFGSKQGLEDQHVNGGCPLFVPAVANCIGVSPSCHLTPNVASGQGDVVAFDAYNQVVDGDISKTVAARNDQDTASVIIREVSVRRLTPVECERLQGFPDNYTLINVKGKPSPDGGRYKALGNSMAVPVMHWIGERIKSVV